MIRRVNMYIILALIAMNSVACAISLGLGLSQKHATCEAVNRNSAAIRTLIVAGAENSRPFEKLYAKYGLPSYAVRVRQARAIAAKFPALPDCPIPPIR